MVVWFFEFIWLLWILTSSEVTTTHSGTIQGSWLFIFLFYIVDINDNIFLLAWTSNVCFSLTSSAVGRSAYAGSYGSRTTRILHDVEQEKPPNNRAKFEVKNQNEGKNTQMDFNQGISHFKAAEGASTTARQSNGHPAGRKDLPEIYILVLVSGLYILHNSRWWQFHDCIRDRGVFFVCL